MQETLQMIDKGVDTAHAEHEASSAAAERRVSVTLTSLQKAEPAPKRGRMALAGKAALMKGLTGGAGAAPDAPAATSGDLSRPYCASCCR